MPETGSPLRALRASHERLAALVKGMTPEQLTGPAYPTEWSVAQTLSHIGSSAEVFRLITDAGLSGGEAPGREVMVAIWQRWNALPAEAQAAGCVAANERLLRHWESLEVQELAGFHLAVFGREMDAVGLLRGRLSEHAIHTWDIDVALDPAATVAADAVDELVDFLPVMTGRAGKPLEIALTLEVATTGPGRHLALALDGVRLEPWSEQEASGALHLPAEALLRLVYGRLDAAHTPPLTLSAPALTLDDLRAVFPGF